MAKVPKKIKMIENLKKFIQKNRLDGYIVPKNDKYFTEYSNVNNLMKVSNFSGSAGFALILSKKNYLFVDGRYTLQAKKQSGKNFVICEIPNVWPKDVLTNNNFRIGFDPKLFTQETLDKYFDDKINLVPITFKFPNKNKKNENKFYELEKSVTGETMNSKVDKLRKILKKNNINYLYISSSENVCWLLNIRGKDLPNSPLANCKILFNTKGNLYLLTDLEKTSNLKKKNFKDVIFLSENNFFSIICNFDKGNFCIDKNSCSIFEENLIRSKFKIVSRTDPIYDFKSLKNSTEIKNTQKVHIIDGVAVTKFLYWFKKRKKNFSEKQIEKKLESFRKKSKNYLYPSFETIAGSGPNGSIIHYKSNKNSNRIIKKNDVLLVDSGGQYKWGTTDITRTTISGKASSSVKNNFTRVLKGHIAVVTCNLKKYHNGYLIDNLARKPLKKIGLDYSHGTGHGVGFFLNVHEGPQAISKYNRVKFKKGMILSNEPGLYLNNKYGIRIENLIYVDDSKKQLFFKNLTFAPIDLDMINFNLLTKIEKKYLFDYHLEIYSKISKYLNKNEKKWLINLIK